ncbi:uncharacterized protein [Mytilus edulis]|uniref:uncharacterized protein n=1 Tax=Mytilus edulis TaxID=6550 RepID=UPI0039EFD81B
MSGFRGFEFVLLVVSLMMCYVKSQATHKLDNSTDNECGKMFTIHPDEEIILTTSGRAPKGFCTAVVYALGKDGKNCHGMCMSVTSQFIDLCDAKVQFKGMDFGREDDPYRELSCFHKLPTEWCFQTNTMSVEIVETHFYAFNMDKLSYNFNVKVSPVCDDSPFGKDIQARENARKASEADARTRARIHGILVGVCLAIVFLIVLLITWCYYKNKPLIRRDIHNYPTAHVRKGPTFAGFKAKMTFHKAQSPDEGASETKPKKEKKRKQSKDEASLENEEAKPKKRGGLKFLNKLRSHRAEEVPLVEKKDVEDNAARVAEKIEDEINEILDENVDKKLENDNRTEDKDTEKDDEKTGDGTEDTNKPDQDEAIESGDKTSSEPVPSVTVTAAGENDSKNDSSDDS